MKTAIILAVMLVVAWLVTLPLARERRRRLRRFWSRHCTGPEWRARFPDASKQSIREFLDTFLDGFAFSTRKRLKFGPDDKVMDVYRALYPSTGWADSLELETFAINLRDRYGFDLGAVQDHDITLGQLFEMTRGCSHTASGTRQPPDESPEPSR